jgi:hypothetical protein
MPDKRKEQDEEATGKLDQQQPDDAESKLNDQDPGHRQKENQNKQKDDPLAA